MNRRNISTAIISAVMLLLVSCSEPPRTKAIASPRKMVFCAPSFDPETLNAANAPLFDGLGTLHYTISTKDSLAQKYFDQGLTLMYAFNHGEAGRSFKAVITNDSSCAMGYWGLAMIMGPNYNAPLDTASLSQINQAVAKALDLSANTDPREQALILALSKRFPASVTSSMSSYNRAYAAAMKNAFQKFPDDPEIGALYADALMNEHPWDMWLKDGSSRPWTNEIVSVLENQLKRFPDHVGVNHLYIHIIEASTSPAKAVASAEKLRTMLPAAGHLVHMPSHIDLRTGDYHKGVVTNENASLADSSYIAQCRISGAYPMFYYSHNIHFLAACAFLEGNSSKAIAAAWQVSKNARKETDQHNITIQHYSVIPYYVLVQTGKWNDIKKIPAPDRDLLYSSAIWHYAQGMADIGRGNRTGALAQLDTLKKIAANSMLQSQRIWDINSAGELVAIAELVLRAEIASASKKFTEAEKDLRAAAAIEDKLMYQEPPDWFFSIRHSLGDVLLQAKNWKAAEEVYLQDMIAFPENGYALMGLYKSLTGQGREADAQSVKARFDKAWQWADLAINSSRIR